MPSGSCDSWSRHTGPEGWASGSWLLATPSRRLGWDLFPCIPTQETKWCLYTLKGKHQVHVPKGWYQEHETCPRTLRAKRKTSGALTVYSTHTKIAAIWWTAWASYASASSRSPSGNVTCLVEQGLQEQAVGSIWMSSWP
jgi:hypothetical protein